MSSTSLYGVQAGTVLLTGVYIYGLVAASVFAGTPVELAVAMVLIAGWLVLPVSIVVDSRSLPAATEWTPKTIVWGLLAAVPVAQFVVGPTYLARRHYAVSGSLPSSRWLTVFKFALIAVGLHMIAYSSVWFDLTRPIAPYAFDGLQLAGLLIAPPVLYFDSVRLRATTDWDLNTMGWVAAVGMPVVALIAGPLYLYRRREVA